LELIFIILHTFEELDKVNEAANPTITDVEVVGITREIFPDVFDEMLEKIDLDRSRAVYDPITIKCIYSNNKEIELEVVYMHINRFDFDAAKISLWIECDVHFIGDPREFGEALMKALNRVGYNFTSYVGFRRASMDADALTFEYKF
jgi:hypothetical protein